MAFKRQNWSVLPPGAQESLSLGQFTAVVKYIGPWSERLLFADSMMGWPYYTGVADDWIPDTYVITPKGRSLYTGNAPYGVSATIAAYKGDQQAIGARTDKYSDINWMESYEKAVVTITYELPGVGDPVQVIGGDRGRGDLISEDFEPNAEFTTLDKDRFEWFDPSTTVPLSKKLRKVSDKEAPGKLFVGMDYVFTRHSVTSVLPEVFTRVNHVNSTALSLVTPLLNHITFSPGTVLYRGARLNRVVKLSGESNMNLVMVFALRQIPHPGNNPLGDPDAWKFYGWNDFYHGGAGKWLKLRRTSDSGTHSNYPSAELNAL